MTDQFVFYLADYPSSSGINALKVAYIEELNYWKRNKHLSGNKLQIPLNIQYHLHIQSEIADQVFEITNPSITEQDFIAAGFIKDPSFIDFIKMHENSA